MNKPNKAFFESNPRAQQLRALCLGSTAALEAMERGDKQAFGQLLDCVQELRLMGVEQSMHVITTKDKDEAARQRVAMCASPVVATEWVGGQLLNFLDNADLLRGVDPAVTQEHDELLGQIEGATVVANDANPDLTAFVGRFGFYGTINTLLDAEADRVPDPARVAADEEKARVLAEAMIEVLRREP